MLTSWPMPDCSGVPMKKAILLYQKNVQIFARLVLLHFSSMLRDIAGPKCLNPISGSMAVSHLNTCKFHNCIYGTQPKNMSILA